MKRVLVISFHYPPLGGLRSLGLKKYAPKFGWEVAILTRSPREHIDPQNGVFRTFYVESTYEYWSNRFGLDPSRGFSEQLNLGSHKMGRKSILERILYTFDGVVSYPDPYKRWFDPALKLGRQILQNDKFDAILSTSKPEICHLVARKLKEEFDLPWIGDFRDLWTQNHYYPYHPIRRLVESKLERDTLSSADAITTVSEPLANSLRSFHKSKDIYAIPTGYDPEELQTANQNLTDEFTITYTGTLYGGRRNPYPLFMAIRQLISEGILNPDKIKIRFFGMKDAWLKRMVNEYGLNKIAEINDRVPRQNALEKQRESQILLLLLNNDRRESGVYTGKVFEYLAARRPILAVGGPQTSVLKDLLYKTKAGYYLTTITEIQNVLKLWYLEYMANGKVSYKGIDSEIKKFSQIEMARNFCKVLDNITQ